MVWFMSYKKLVIVESPTKIKTLKKFLDSSYTFESSVGHIIDLPAKGFGIDLEGDFIPQYEVLPDKKEVVARIKRAAKDVDIVYLCPDPDREGEAIAWHIASILPPGTKYERAAFHAITKEAVQNALSHPRTIDLDLVNAQQTRRILDRIVGYKISPLLSRRIQKGGSLSAGRVQSVALKLVVDREKEIEAFRPVEYWRIEVNLKSETDERIFKASLLSVDGKRVEKETVEGKNYFIISNKETAEGVLERLKGAIYSIQSLEKKEKRRQPVAPFITSSLQMEASRHYGYSSSRTMKIAQELYEGVDMGEEGHEGLITYMRTDSVNIAQEPLIEIRKKIGEMYGNAYLNPEIRQFTSRKSAQEAHEAIRPTNWMHPPENLRKYLTKDQFNIYDIIWKRTLASQMTPAVYDTVSADIDTQKGLLFRATGSTLKFSGFLAVYEERDDEEKEGEEKLPPLSEKDPLIKINQKAERSFTKPPARYTEASLIKELERLGIGRPSTYATIMNKIQSREYTTKESQRLKPTELGRIIADFLDNNFKAIINVSFTAEMEEDLERVAEHKKEWKKVLQEFWNHFKPIFEIAEKEAFVPKVTTDIKCPLCEAPLQKIWAKGRYFLGCSAYPECSYTVSEEQQKFNKEEYNSDFNWDQPCSKCGSSMVVRFGRYGAFLGCSIYPECKGIVNIPLKGESLDAVEAGEKTSCPAIGCSGYLVQKRSRFGKNFYSCSTYPECDVIANTPEQVVEKYKDYPRKAAISSKKTAYKKAAVTKKTTAKGPIGKRTATKSTAVKKSVVAIKAPRKSPSSGNLIIAPELSAVVGSEATSRPEITKKLWDYIKSHNLQDVNNRRLINPDALLAKVFGSTDALDMMQLAKKITPHIKAS